MNFNVCAVDTLGLGVETARAKPQIHHLVDGIPHSGGTECTPLEDALFKEHLIGLGATLVNPDLNILPKAHRDNLLARGCSHGSTCRVSEARSMSEESGHPEAAVY
jgi:hypothetical protein